MFCSLLFGVFTDAWRSLLQTNVHLQKLAQGMFRKILETGHTDGEGTRETSKRNGI